MLNNGKEHFYKYVTADAAKLILKNLQVKYSSPDLFNDPFDNQFDIQINTGENKEEVKEIYGRIFDSMARAKKVGASPKESFFAATTLNKNLISVVKEDSEKTLKIFIDLLRQGNKIFCISENYDNLLMWAHYADEHKGAVIKLKCLHKEDTLLCAAEKVQYSAIMQNPRLDELIVDFDIDSSANKIFKDCIYTKSRDWQYEQEWRVVLPTQDSSSGHTFINLREEELDSIYLGCKMAESDKQEILGITKTQRKNIRVFQAEKDAKIFKLNFHGFK